MSRSTRTKHGLWPGLLLLALPFAGCSGSDGAAGAHSATLTGTVTNTANGNAAVGNATVTTSPAVAGAAITTNPSGVYVAELPAGVYTVTCAAANFTSTSAPLSVLAGVPVTLNFALAPTSNVAIAVGGLPAQAAPGASFMLTATATPLDGSTVQGYQWAQTSAAAATISGPTTATPSITLADAAAYKQNLIDHLNVQDRWAVLGIDPHAAELGATAAFEVTVTTSSGTYKKEVEVTADLAFCTWCTGLENVPLGLPVLVGGKVQANYNWALTKPGTSATALQDATTRFPWFVPDVAGYYTLTATDIGASGPATVELRAAAWHGGIVGIDANGRPETDCATSCHSTPMFFVEKFTAWAASGHAAIFSDNIETGGHYGSDCFACHTVGHDPSVQNGGFDDSTGYDTFLGAMFPGGQSHPNASNWNTVVGSHPAQAKLANIQCENCHGPNGVGATHGAASASARRVSTSAAVCGVCHGEPPRHGRYQQWQESGHGNFATAIGEGTSASCAKCHTAQGFLEWFQNGLSPTFGGTAVPVNDIQPITCVVCHDPHNVGSVSGDGNDAPLRVEGDSPPLLAGYTAHGLGKGAMCIVCHNTRRGDADAALNATPDRAPHLGAQGDVMMGENVFFVTNVRGPHSLITDTCVACHVGLSPPPADLSYQLAGTNHSFAADLAICANCHGSFDANALKALTQSRLTALAAAITVAIEKEIAFHTAAGRAVRITGLVNNVSTTTDIVATSVVDVLEVVESHGRSAMTIRIDNVDYHEVQINGNTQIMVAGVANGRLLANTFSGVEQILARVLWNYNMIHADHSSGIHNPGLVLQMFAASNEQLTVNWP